MRNKYYGDLFKRAERWSLPAGRKSCRGGARERRWFVEHEAKGIAEPNGTGAAGLERLARLVLDVLMAMEVPEWFLNDWPVLEATRRGTPQRLPGHWATPTLSSGQELRAHLAAAYWARAPDAPGDCESPWQGTFIQTSVDK